MNGQVSHLLEGVELGKFFMSTGWFGRHPKELPFGFTTKWVDQASLLQVVYHVIVPPLHFVNVRLPFVFLPT